MGGRSSKIHDMCPHLKNASLRPTSTTDSGSKHPLEGWIVSNNLRLWPRKILIPLLVKLKRNEEVVCTWPAKNLSLLLAVREKNEEVVYLMSMD